MTVESVKPEATAAPELREPPLRGRARPRPRARLAVVRDPLSLHVPAPSTTAMSYASGSAPRRCTRLTAPDSPAPWRSTRTSSSPGRCGSPWRACSARRAWPPANGPLHRRQRRVIQPAFRLDAIPGYGPIMEEEAHALAERWRARRDPRLHLRGLPGRRAHRGPLSAARRAIMDERAERHLRRARHRLPRHVPAHGGTRSGRFTGCPCRPTANSIGRWPICIASSTRSSPSAGHPVKSRTIC